MVVVVSGEGYYEVSVSCKTSYVHGYLFIWVIFMGVTSWLVFHELFLMTSLGCRYRVAGLICIQFNKAMQN